MKKKAQTEDIFADLIPSLILIVAGIFVLQYFSSGHSTEIKQNEVLVNTMEDREAFSVEGMMNHKIEYNKVKYKLIDLIDRYNKEEKTSEMPKYEDAMMRGIIEYISQIKPEITSCFEIKLKPSLKKEVDLLGDCELKEARTEETIIPLSNGGYAEVRIKYGKTQVKI